MNANKLWKLLDFVYFMKWPRELLKRNKYFDDIQNNIFYFIFNKTIYSYCNQASALEIRFDKSLYQIIVSRIKCPLVGNPVPKERHEIRR